MASEPTTVSCDDEAARLLPWLVNGRLDAADVLAVEAHLVSCPDCRDSVRELRELRRQMREDERVEYSPQPALQKLMSRIDEMEREVPVAPEVDAEPEDVGPAPARGVPRWIVAALVVQTCGLGLLGAAVWRQSSTVDSPAPYATLSSARPAYAHAPQVRVVFAPGTTVDQLAALLASVGATIVDGPSEAGAYSLALTPGAAGGATVDASVAHLRSDTHVLFAEPVAVAGGTTR